MLFQRVLVWWHLMSAIQTPDVAWEWQNSWHNVSGTGNVAAPLDVTVRCA